MNKKPHKSKIDKSSGNVFEDLGLPNTEECLVKAELARQINNILKKKGLTQKEAANILNIDQPKISALYNGRLKGFSIERLFKFLIMLNYDINITIKPHKVKRTNIYSRNHIHVAHASI